MSKTLLDLKGAEFDKKYMGEVVTGHTNQLAAYKKAKGEVKDNLLVKYVDGTEPIVAEHLKKAKQIEAKLTKYFLPDCFSSRLRNHTHRFLFT